MSAQQFILPSNKKFGVFFGFIFNLVGVYYLSLSENSFAAIFIALGVLFILVAILKSELLLPLNKLWMGLGEVLGRIVRPLVMAMIFFSLFAVIGIITRFLGRDELKLKKGAYASTWVSRSGKKETNFEQQF